MEILKENQRKTFERSRETAELVSSILSGVAQRGDEYLKELTQKFDGVELSAIRVSDEERRAAYDKVDEKTVGALKEAASQIRFFAQKQKECLKPLETQTPVPGVTLGHRLVPVDSCGAYVPGGRYPLPSTALMLCIPAKVAGVSRVAACSPASREYGGIHPAVLAAMDIGGADEIYCMGGAQAVAAFTYGTESVPKVDMIVGPGNRFVTEAKRQVLGEVGIDSLAGPSEVLILADGAADPEYIAADLLAQCEHDPNARATLAVTSRELAARVAERLAAIAKELPTGETALRSWEDNGSVLLARSMEEAVDFANEMAPEHLEVQAEDAEGVSRKLRHFGSLFIGAYTPVAFGDYCSGTNHTLPTLRTARYSGGVWPGTFLKTSFYQHITQEGCRSLADTCMRLAQTEGLAAHRKSVEVRLK